MRVGGGRQLFLATFSWAKTDGTQLRCRLGFLGAENALMATRLEFHPRVGGTRVITCRIRT